MQLRQQNSFFSLMTVYGVIWDVIMRVCRVEASIRIGEIARIVLFCMSRAQVYSAAINTTGKYRLADNVLNFPGAASAWQKCRHKTGTA